MTKPFFGALLSAMMTVLAPAAFAQIPAPAGYAPYCSMLYLNGGWDFKLGQSGGDPCADLSKPGANIARAGLWHVGADASGGGSGSGENNILIRCGGKQPPIPKVPMPLVDRGVGTDFINKTVAKVKAVKGLTNCVVTVAPDSPADFRPTLWANDRGTNTGRRCGQDWRLRLQLRLEFPIMVRNRFRPGPG